MILRSGHRGVKVDLGRKEYEGVHMMGAVDIGGTKDRGGNGG